MTAQQSVHQILRTFWWGGPPGPRPAPRPAHLLQFDLAVMGVHLHFRHATLSSSQSWLPCSSEFEAKSSARKNPHEFFAFSPRSLA